LILLVGAAGFEPTTCSTQNCRATRLRYTPNALRRRSHRTLDYWLSMILWDNRCALCANAALRVRIMLWRRRRYTPKAPAARLGLREKRVQGLAALHPACCNRSYGGAAVSARTAPASRSPGESRPPSCPWSPARSAPARIGQGGARSCRSAATSPYARRCPACPPRR
jgi:hypothetical protein